MSAEPAAFVTLAGRLLSRAIYAARSCETARCPMLSLRLDEIGEEQGEPVRSASKAGALSAVCLAGVVLTVSDTAACCPPELQVRGVTGFTRTVQCKHVS